MFTRTSSPSINPRRPKSFLSSLTANYLHLRNPYVITWWSAAFPGFGHISLGNYVQGFLLFTWEMIVNTQAQVNLGIFYSFTGRYDMAKEVVDSRWLLLYAPVFIFAMWSSYRLTVTLNGFSILADRNHSPIDVAQMSVVELNFVDKRSPWVAVMWSALTPGVAHLYTHRLPTGFFLLVWWIAICYFSHVLQAIQYTALGEFEQAKEIINIQWFIDLPSIYGYALYDAYANIVETNRLYDREQADYLTKQYQSSDFIMPV